MDPATHNTLWPNTVSILKVMILFSNFLLKLQGFFLRINLELNLLRFADMPCCCSKCVVFKKLYFAVFPIECRGYKPPLGISCYTRLFNTSGCLPEGTKYPPNLLQKGLDFLDGLNFE